MTKLEATSSGFADVRKAGSSWLLEFGNTNITRVKARRVPNLLYTSNNTVLVGRCSVSHEGYNGSAFTTAGSFLWRQRWADCRYSPGFRGSGMGAALRGKVTIRLKRQRRLLRRPANRRKKDWISTFRCSIRPLGRFCFRWLRSRPCRMGRIFNVP